MRVMLVALERAIRDTLIRSLAGSTLSVVHVDRLDEAPERARQTRPDLVVVDVHDERDLAAVEALAETAPVLVRVPDTELATRAAAHVAVADFVLREASERELALRLTRLARIVPGEPRRASAPLPLELRCARVTPEARALHVGCDEETRPLTTGEAFVFAELWHADGEVVPRQRLAWAVSSRPAAPSDKGLEAIVSRLRRKLACRNSCNEDAVRAVRGRGYRMPRR
jgi:DNA-binding response OmpR family regulator